MSMSNLIASWHWTIVDNEDFSIAAKSCQKVNYPAPLPPTNNTRIRTRAERQITVMRLNIKYVPRVNINALESEIVKLLAHFTLSANITASDLHIYIFSKVYFRTRLLLRFSHGISRENYQNRSREWVLTVATRQAGQFGTRVDKHASLLVFGFWNSQDILCNEPMICLLTIFVYSGLNWCFNQPLDASGLWI